MDRLADTYASPAVLCYHNKTAVSILSYVCSNYLHELVSVMSVCDSLPYLPQQQTNIILLQQRSLIGLQQSKGHSEEHLGPLMQQCIPYSGCSL